MSTFLYGALAAKREDAKAGESTKTEPPATRPYVDALAALVPAEVLLAHAAVLGWSTSTTTDNKKTQAIEQTTVKVTDPTTLKWAFIALAVLSVAFYLAARSATKDKKKKAPSVPILLLQCLVPPLAFALWTMLQEISAFDGIWPQLAVGPRQTIGIIGAVALSLLAGFLGYRLDKKEPKPKA